MTLTTHPKLHKRVGPIYPRNAVEETSLFIRNGRLMSISFDRGVTPHVFVIRDVLAYTAIAAWPWPGGFGNIMVDGDDIYIAGSRNSYMAGNDTIVSKLDPVTYEPTPPVSVYTAPVSSENYYCALNTGICKGGPDGYIMTVDVMDRKPDSQGRASKQEMTMFLRASNPLGTWTRFGAPIFVPQSRYMGALKPFYVPGDAHCYFVYIAGTGPGDYGYAAPPFFMNIARTLDFLTFQSFEGLPAIPSARLICPEYPIDNINNSDGSQPLFHNGGVVMNYFCGDQSTWAEMRTVLYQGTLPEFIAEFFP